jgi:3-oxoacyl-[acyl-carrier protein] reductase
MDLKLKNKVVFVSASGQGIGAETAKQFLEEGARVLINDTDKVRLLSFYKKLKSKHGNHVDYFAGDVTDEKMIIELKKHLISKWGRIDILICNLGTGKSLSPERLNLDDWERFMEINLYSAVKLLKILLPELKKSKESSIVMMSSIVGLQQSSAPLGYSAAKTSILSLVKNLSYEIAPFGIRINAVAPGNIFFQNGRWEEIVKNNPKVIDSYIKKDVPLGRFGMPEEIASAIVFLASSKSSFTTGACLVVDGGETRNY